MCDSNRKISCSQKIICSAAVMVILWICGCGDILGEKHTGAQVNSIISDLSRIEIVPDPNIPLPEVYRRPPEIVKQMVGGAPEWKLFYFCKYHTSEKLRDIVHQQFATKLFNEKGKSTTVTDYTVSTNPATNQLIVRCPTEDDVDAVLELLEMVDVPPIQVRIDCLISEIYADRTLDWQTTIQIEELFDEDIWAGPTATAFGATVSELLTEPDFLPAFPGASLRDVARAKMGLKIGYWKADKYLALVDILESEGYLKILMNPTIETINGQKAIIKSTEHVPLQKITIRSTISDYFETSTEYIDVVDSLEITPHVFANGYIGLETNILLGAKSIPEGVKQIPIVTKRQIINKENRIRQGESLIIGGLRKTKEYSVIRGIPLLKDIPLFGILFSGKDFEERVVETIFILTPTISTGGMPSEDMVGKIRRRHEPPVSSEGLEAITDPFRFRAREKERERKALEAKEAQLEAEKGEAEARHAAREAAAKAEKVKAEAKEEVGIVKESLLETAEGAIAEKAKAIKTAEEVKKAKAEAEKAKAEAEKAKAEAEKAEKAKAEAEKARAKAEKDAAEATKAKEAAEKAKAEAEAKAKADAEARVKAEAEARAKAANAGEDAQKEKPEAKL